MSRSVFTAEYQLQSGYIALSANKRTDVKYSLVSDRDSDLKPIFHFIIRHNKRTSIFKNTKKYYSGIFIIKYSRYLMRCLTYFDLKNEEFYY